MSFIVQVDKISEGMVVSEPVINNFGMILIPSGVIINENHKRLLKMWNIKTVSIKSSTNEEDASIPDEILLIATEILQSKMKWRPRNDIETNLFKNAVFVVGKNILKTK